MKVVVVGAGIIGASAVWELARAGHDVTVVDPDPAQAAAAVAAGMLAPVAEVVHGEDALLALNIESAARWPSFATELKAASGIDPGFVPCGTVLAARDRDDLTVLTDVADHQRALGVEAVRLTSRELRRLEPALGPTVRGGVHLPDDHQVDPRRVLAALGAAHERLGVVQIRDRVDVVSPTGVSLRSGDTVDADAVVVAAGWSAGELLDLPVRPVKGQILRLRADGTAVIPHLVVRGLDMYVTPRPTGEIVVGATQEERGADRTVTAGGVHALLHAAWELLPGLLEAELVEASAGLRPGTPDNAPIIAEHAGCIVATGHHRNGVLLAPVTARAVVALVEGREFAPVRGFGPRRFEAVPA